MSKGRVEKEAVKYIDYFMTKRDIIQYETQRDYIGIDAFYEIFSRTEYNGLFFAAQIKSGDSYFNGDDCYYYDHDHAHIEKWKTYKVPVFLFVFSNTDEQIYWINIQKYIMENPQDKKVGFTFRFSKEDNVLNDVAIDEILLIVKAKVGEMKDIIEKIIYEHTYYKILASRCMVDTTLQNLSPAIQLVAIDEWLKERKYEDQIHRFTKSIAEYIQDHVNGIGIIGSFLLISDMRSVDFFVDSFQVEYTNHEMKSYNNLQLYDLNRSEKFFNNYIVEDKVAMKICNYNGIEVLITDGYAIRPKAITLKSYIAQQSLRQSNRTQKIPKECNEILDTILNDESNVMVLGPSTGSHQEILSTFTDFFKFSDKVLVVEDRRTIQVIRGEVQRLTALSTDSKKMIEMIDTSLNIEADHKIYDIGNLTLNKDVFHHLLKNTNDYKGCLIHYTCGTDYLYNFSRELQFTLKLYNSTTHDFFEAIDHIKHYVILKYYHDRGLYISRIWSLKEEGFVMTYRNPFLD